MILSNLSKSMTGLNIQMVIQVITANPNTGASLPDAFEEIRLKKNAKPPNKTIDHNKYTHFIIVL